jgi:hypothetical protein
MTLKMRLKINHASLSGEGHLLDRHNYQCKMLLRFDILKLSYLNYAPNSTKALFYACLLERPLPLYTTSYYTSSHFWFNALWLVYFHLFKSLLSEYHFRFTLTFSGTRLRRKAKAFFNVYLDWLFVCFPVTST